VEVALFGAGATGLTSPAGARRCAYTRSATRLAGSATRQVLDDWTGTRPYRTTFIDGMDGNPQSSVAAIVNELTFRLQEADDQGLRTFTEATSYDDLPASRKEGPGAYGLASLRAILDGVVAVIRGPVGEPGLAALVRGHDEAIGDQLDRLAGEAESALRALPVSIAAALADRAGLTDATRAVSALRVLVSTTVASQLGVTIGFSDADGDS
jgi:predicted lipoprotein